MSEVQEKVTNYGQTDEISFCRLDEPFCERGQVRIGGIKGQKIEKMQ